MDPAKLDAVTSSPYPQNKKELQSFIGFCNFYRKFSDHHASHMSPLIELLKNKSWSLSAENRAQFDQVKVTLGNHVLGHPNFAQPFFLQTDASKVGLGVELYQIDIGGRRTIAFASRVLNAAERKVTELELLSIVFTCQKFRVFILGHKTTVVTDHQALVFLNRCRLRNARLTRWTLLLQEYDLHIEHCPGKDNIIDVLSRNPVGRNEIPPDEMPFIFRLKIKVPPELPTELVDSFKTLRQDQSTDSRLAVVLMDLESPLGTLHNFYKIHNGVLFFRRFTSSEQWLVCIPSVHEFSVVVSVHEFYGHVGARKCAAVLKEACYFPNLSRRIRSILAHCDLCQRTKHRTVRS